MSTIQFSAHIQIDKEDPPPSFLPAPAAALLLGSPAAASPPRSTDAYVTSAGRVRPAAPSGSMAVIDAWLCARPGPPITSRSLEFRCSAGATPLKYLKFYKLLHTFPLDSASGRRDSLCWMIWSTAAAEVNICLGRRPQHDFKYNKLFWKWNKNS